MQVGRTQDCNLRDLATLRYADAHVQEGTALRFVFQSKSLALFVWLLTQHPTAGAGRTYVCVAGAAVIMAGPSG